MDNPLFHPLPSIVKDVSMLKLVCRVAPRTLTRNTFRRPLEVVRMQIAW